ncbi:MAG: fibrobacter succinogenes major paralogous domain-containing protein [Bacteroidales bacterium]|jgi:uncharacterized protein (TIGR02145 family)|nr:fibrobacter succinogenes major paralogous domain-containing protein [Bacteroidales bacterium]
MKQKILIALLVTFLSFVIIWACKDEELPEFSRINKVELTITEDSTSYVFSQINCILNQKPVFTIEQHGFCWDTIANVTIEKQKSNNGTLNAQSFNETIENLLPNKTYFVKSYIQNQEAIIYSNELTIQTLDAKPIVTTNDIINILAKNAQSGGTVSSHETLFPITQRGVCWAKTQNPTIVDSLTLNGTGNGTFTSQLQNLEIGETYFARAYAINSQGITYGNEKTFSTLDGIPDLATDSIKNITATSATFYGNLIENDGLEILEKGFCWSTNTNPTIGNSFQIVTGSALGSFNKDITGLAINTTFYVKAYLKNTKGTFYGNQLNFATENGLPTVTTTTISNITATSAESGGNVTDDGGFAITSRGVCWSTTSNPTIANNHTTNSSGTGSFSSNLTGLNVNTTYYVRAYATNTNGTVYGTEYNFTTEDGLPTLTTTSISNITPTSAESGGNITDDGGFPILSRGICWSTNTEPTTTDNLTSDGTGLGSFVSNISVLIANTTYYVRAYATNSNGIRYGNQVSFKTTNIVTDIDGNVYKTVVIGSQEWMAENLKTTKYNDGTPISLITDNTAWPTTSGAYCWYNNDIGNKTTYGALYNWYAVVDSRKLCPVGWHVPTDTEWSTLTTYLGGESVAGGKMKAITLWASPNMGADNSSGFTALPGGSRSYDGYFDNVGYYGGWWSSTEGSTYYAFYRGLNYGSSSVDRGYDYRRYGFSVRCLRD